MLRIKNFSILKKITLVLIPFLILALMLSLKQENSNGETISFVVPQVKTGQTKIVTPQMYGAKGDGIHDDTEAIRKACKSGAETLYFPNGTYIINIEKGQDKKKDNHFFITGINYIIGESRAETIIKLGKGNGDADGYKGYEAIFSFSGKDAHPEIRNLTFDFNYANFCMEQIVSLR